MSVDFYSCGVCTEVYCDSLSGVGNCGHCEVSLCPTCNKESMDKYGLNEDEQTCKCDKCSGEFINHQELVSYMLTFANKGKGKELTVDEWWEELRETKEQE